eukprot:2699653-Pyramimonas_sp.AAC.1
MMLANVAAAGGPGAAALGPEDPPHAPLPPAAASRQQKSRHSRQGLACEGRRCGHAFHRRFYK